jgi:mercuric ion binding protein
MKKNFIMLLMTIVVSQPVWAASKTVALAIPGMTCAACPVTIKIALNRVPGVTATTVNFENRQAIVTFDDAKTDIEALLRATSEAGYPASLIKGAMQ